jgi:hypothetical protein
MTGMGYFYSSSNHPRRISNRTRARGAFVPFARSPSRSRSLHDSRSDRYLASRMVEQRGSLSQDPLGFVDGVNMYKYADLTPIFLNDPSGLSCKIRLRCARVAYYLARHCGFVVRTDDDYYSYDGSGGPTNTINIHRPPWTNGTFYRWKTFPDSVCECLKTERRRWNALSVPRDRFCKNSNWTLHCAMKKCRVTMPWRYRPLKMPIGWNCKTCAKWEVEPNAFCDALVLNQAKLE